MDNKKSLKHKLMSILFYVVTIFLGLYIVMSIMAPSKVIDVFNFQIASVPTNSMEPTIEVNDLIFEVKTNPDKIEVDDIIIFNNYLPADSDGDGSSDTYALASVVHRVVEINEIDGIKYYVTQGDNPNNEIDVVYESLEDAVNDIPGSIVKDDIIAKYAFRIPYIGAISIYVSQHVDPVFMGLIIINIIIIVALIKVLKKKPDKEEASDHDLE